GLRFLVPAADRLDGAGVAHQHGVQPLTQQLLGEHRVAPAGTHEIRQRPDHRVAEPLPLFEQGLGCGRQPHALALQLGEGIAPPARLPVLENPPLAAAGPPRARAPSRAAPAAGRAPPARVWCAPPAPARPTRGRAPPPRTRRRPRPAPAPPGRRATPPAPAAA